MHVEARRVFAARGSSSQTINVCTPANERGNYQQVYRLARSDSVTDRQVADQRTLVSLDEWLVGRGAVREGAGVTPGNGTPPRSPPLIDLPPGAAWLTTATRVVEVAIDSLVLEFVEHPYLHRVEHSIHARLFGILAAHSIFAHLIPIGRTGHHTQPVHKEWPETRARPGKKGRRGNFDLVVLAPAQLAQATLEQFATAGLPPR